MKRKIIMAIIMATTLVLSVGTMSVFATEPARGQSTVVPWHHGACGRILTAFESDWTCDYCGSTCHFLDEDGDGLCDYHVYQDGYQYNFGQGYDGSSQQATDGYGGQQAANDYGSQQTTDGYGYQGGYGTNGQGGYDGYCDNYGNYCDNYDNYGYCGGRGGNGHHGGYGNGGHHGHHGR